MGNILCGVCFVCSSFILVKIFKEYLEILAHIVFGFKILIFGNFGSSKALPLPNVLIPIIMKVVDFISTNSKCLA